MYAVCLQKKIISTFCLHLQQSILGLPWFLDTAIVNPDEYVKVQSKGRLKKIKIIKKFREFEIFSHHMAWGSKLQFSNTIPLVLKRTCKVKNLEILFFCHITFELVVMNRGYPKSDFRVLKFSRKMGLRQVKQSFF